MRVVLGGISLPGIADVTGLKVSNRWDIKEAPGTDGATETYKGYTPASFVVLVRMWEPQHWVEIQAAIAKIRPRPGKETPAALDVVHPKLAPFGIKSAIVTDLSLDGPDDQGTGTLTISCREYFAQPKKNTTGTAATSKGGPGVKEKYLEGERIPDGPLKTDRKEPPLPARIDDVPPGATATEHGAKGPGGGFILGDTL
jgi:hypothetical protein